MFDSDRRALLRRAALGEATAAERIALRRAGEKVDPAPGDVFWTKPGWSCSVMHARPTKIEVTSIAKKGVVAIVRCLEHGAASLLDLADVAPGEVCSCGAPGSYANCENVFWRSFRPCWCCGMCRLNCASHPE